MKSSDPITQLWDYAAPFIAAGKIDRSFIMRACKNGLTYKPGWLEKMKAAVDEEAVRPRFRWEIEMRVYEITLDELSFLGKLRNTAQPWRVADLRKGIRPPHRFHDMIAKFEQRGWIEVERSERGWLKAVRAKQLPEVINE